MTSRRCSRAVPWTTPEVLAAAAAAPEERLLPDVTVIMVGGQSLVDRGREAVFPLLEEIVETPGSTGC